MVHAVACWAIDEALRFDEDGLTRRTDRRARRRRGPQAGPVGPPAVEATSWWSRACPCTTPGPRETACVAAEPAPRRAPAGRRSHSAASTGASHRPLQPRHSPQQRHARPRDGPPTRPAHPLAREDARGSHGTAVVRADMPGWVYVLRRGADRIGHVSKKHAAYRRTRKHAHWTEGVPGRCPSRASWAIASADQRTGWR